MIGAAAAGCRRQVLLVGEHLGHRHLRLDDGHGAARVHAADPAAAAVEIAHQIAGEIGRGIDLDVHDRLENRRPRPRHRVLERQRPRQLERQLVRIDVVVGAIEHRHAEVDHRVAGEIPARARVLNAFFDRGHELARDGAAEDVVDELEVGAARQRLHPYLAVAELAVAAGLFLVPAVRLGRRLDRLAVRDARRLQVDVDAEAALQLRHRHLDVQLPLS